MGGSSHAVFAIGHALALPRKKLVIEMTAPWERGGAAGNLPCTAFT
jgi:hypothetical protein